MDESSTRQLPRGKLYGWLVLVVALTAISYSARAGASEAETRNALYDYATAVGGAVQYVLLLGFVLLIARGGLRETLGLARPRSWRHAGALLLAALVAIWVIGALLDTVLKAGEEQGLTPDRWRPDRAGAYAANFVVVAFLGPTVEELAYRGLGYSVLTSFYGTVAAIVVTALAFGLAHGLIVALPVLAIFGAILALLRLLTRSIYPPIVLHVFFNATALVAAVTVLAD